MWIWYVDAIQKRGLESRRQAKWEKQQIVLIVEKVDGLKDTGTISMLEVKEGGVNDQTIRSIRTLGDLPN